jgi:iron(III) transport system ATP-binding protein
MPSQLSGGQQQRVALARALVLEPKLLLLDEPLSNLDAKLRESMRFEIKELQNKLAMTVVYVTHDQSEAMAMSDKIIVMNRGVIQQVGTPVEIYEHPANETVADFIGLVNFIDAQVGKDTVLVPRLGVDFKGSYGFEGEGTIAIRPENLEITSGPSDIQGILEARSYLGDSVDYRIRVKDEVLRVFGTAENMNEFQIGDTVNLRINKMLVFPMKKN